MNIMARRMRRWLGTALAAALGLTACGGSGGGSSNGNNNGGGSTVERVDDSYDFGAAGVTPGAATTNGDRGTVAGTVRDAAGQPAKGVTVTLQRLHTVSSRAVGVGSATTVTGDNGSYLFGNVETGRYRIGMEGQHQDKSVAAGRVEVASFTGATTGTGGGNGGTLVVDESYDFGAAGAQPGNGSRDSGRGSLVGSVLDTAGKPSAQVALTLLRLKQSGTGRANTAGVGSATTSSDTSGRYAFGNLEPGSYRVEMESQSRAVDVIADADTTADFTGATTGVSGGGTGHRKWTLIMYMNADNDLEPFGVQDVNELEQLPASSEVAIVVLMDRSPGFDTSNGNWTDTRRFTISPDTDTLQMSSARTASEGGAAVSLGEIDTGDPDTLKSFIEYATTNYPADHYLVDVWNHGAGWRKRDVGTLPIGRGVLFDDSQGTFVKTTDLDDALNTSPGMDLVIFDSSLMQMMEVAYQIRSRCSFVVGSEESPPGEGYPYENIFAGVVANPGTTPEQLAGQIVNTTVDELGDTNQVTQSALRTDRLEAVRNACSSFADVLRSKDFNFHDAIDSARRASQRYGGGASIYEGYKDLVDFAQRCAQLTNDGDITSASSALGAALNAALVAERHAGSGMANSHGLAIFVPSPSGWSELRSAYAELDFAKDSTWDTWLETFNGG